MSATIITLHDPGGINKKDIDYVPRGTLLFDWIIDRYGNDGFEVPTTIYKNGFDEENIIDLKVAAENGDSLILDEDDIITICHCPTGVDPVTIAIAIAVAVVVAVVVASLVPKPEVPELNQSIESPNNNLSGQTNIARPNQRIPDLYGVNIVYPDLIARTYFEFINNVKFLTEFLCIGRGEFLVEELKSGNTLISDIEGATAEVFGPFTRPAELLNVEEANEVNGQEVFAPNEPLMSIDVAFPVEFIDTSTFETVDSAFSDFIELDQGDTFSISGVGYSDTQVTGSSDLDFDGDEIQSTSNNLEVFAVGDFITVTGTSNNNGVVEIDEILPSGGSALVCIDPVTKAAVSFTAETNTSAAIDSVFPNTGTFTFDSLSEVILETPVIVTKFTIVVQETTFTPLVGGRISCVSVLSKNTTVGPFVVPGNPEQVWFDINFPQGLLNGDDAYAVVFDLGLQQIDASGLPIGAPEENLISLQGNNPSARNFTIKITPDNPGNRYEASVTRETNTLSDRDQSKWTRLAGVEDITATDFGNVTAVKIQTVATEQATSIQNREFNAKTTRKLVTFDGTAVTTTTLPTARMADALLDILTDPFMGNKPASQIDLDELFEIQNSLDSDPIYGDRLGRFCYSFSNARTPVGEELISCANATRSFVYREGDLVRFTRDEIQPNRVTLFNRRNKRPNSEQKTETFQKPSDFDSIQLDWVEEETGDPFTVWATATGTTSVDPGDGSNQVPKQIEAAGIKNYEQAWNRAAYEFLKLRHERTRVNTTVTKEGLLVPLNGRVASVDGTDVTAQDGEILAINGLICDTSERPLFDTGSATVILRAENGDLSNSIVVNPRADTDFGFILNNTPTFPIVLRGENGIQIGTLYNFAADSNHLANDYKVQEITPNSDGYVDLKMVNYAPEIFEPDTETPTQRADV